MGLLISEEWAADFSNAFGKNITVREGKEIKYMLIISISR